MPKKTASQRAIAQAKAQQIAKSKAKGKVAPLASGATSLYGNGNHTSTAGYRVAAPPAKGNGKKRWQVGQAVHVRLTNLLTQAVTTVAATVVLNKGNCVRVLLPSGASFAPQQVNGKYLATAHTCPCYVNCKVVQTARFSYLAGFVYGLPTAANIAQTNP